MLSEILTAINQADLPASTRANAFALLSCVHPDNGFVCLEWTEVAELFRLASVRSARRHLTAMKDAGLIHYSTNARVYVTFELISARGRAEIAQSGAVIARDADPAEPAGQSESAEIARQDTRIARVRAEIARLLPPPVGKDLTTGKQQVGKEGLPTYLPAVEAAQGETQTPADQPLTDQERSIDLLTDPAVGCTVDFAEKLAAKHPFAQIRLQVFHALRQMAEPGSRVTSIGIIEHRLKVKAPAAITDADRAGELWSRHRTRAEQEADAAAEAEAERIAAQWEAEHQPPPPAPLRPAPEPGTPAAFWRQLQSDFAMHQQAGAIDSVIQDSWVIGYEDGVFTVGIADAFRLDWVEKKLRNQIKRRLAVIMQRATVDVKFQVGEQQP